MADDSKTSNVGGRYAQALFDLANDEKTMAKVEADLKSLKKALADSLAEAMMQTLGVPPHSISVGIEDVAQPEWMGTVYEPEIAGRRETLFRKPGYGSLSE